MKRDARDALAGAVGGLVGGAVLSGAMLLLERGTGRPSELVLAERRGARELGLRHRPLRSAPGAGEEAAVQAGHLLVSTAVGSGLGILRRGLGTTAPKAGLLLGLGFYAVGYGLLGPLLGLTRPLWRQRPGAVGRGILMNAAFGAVTGLVADRIERL